MRVSEGVGDSQMPSCNHIRLVTERCLQRYEVKCLSQRVSGCSNTWKPWLVDEAWRGVREPKRASRASKTSGLARTMDLSRSRIGGEGQ